MLIEIGTVLNISLWVITIIAFIISNLLKRTKKLEDMVVARDQVLSNVYSLIEQSDQIIKEAEVSKAFQSDDEIGGFFTTLKNIQKALNSYNVNASGNG